MHAVRWFLFVRLLYSVSRPDCPARGLLSSSLPSSSSRFLQPFDAVHFLLFIPHHPDPGFASFYFISLPIGMTAGFAFLIVIFLFRFLPGRLILSPGWSLLANPAPPVYWGCRFTVLDDFPWSIYREAGTVRISRDKTDHLFFLYSDTLGALSSLYLFILYFIAPPSGPQVP